MSRSKRYPIIKDKPRNYKRTSVYWRRVRRVIKNAVRNNVEVLPIPQEIVNDYDYCDYTIRKNVDSKYTRK